MNKIKTFKPIIGLEVHVELDTSSKMFCGCSANHFRVKPNTHTCPVCLGLPGALPVPNQQAIDWTILLGLALNCRVNQFSKFDRKNYFYPDLAKGYQISQYDLPFCQQGYLEIEANDQFKKIRINRVHLEEDTGKLIHRGDSSLIDFNRSGVPLVEIVTEPDINSAEEAVTYLKKLRQIVRCLKVSNADMEKGSMRLEPNISLSQTGDLPNYKVEIKNINSFKFAKKAIDRELDRQEKILKAGQTPDQETRGFNEKTGQTYVQRSKEEAADYRYFPEPDIPPITISEAKIKQLKQALPELPEQKQIRFVKVYGLDSHSVGILLKNNHLAEYFEAVAKLAPKQAVKIAKLIINKKVNIKQVSPLELIKQMEKSQTDQIDDQVQIKTWVGEAIKASPQAVKDLQTGKPAAIGVLIGQVMRLSAGNAKVDLVREIILSEIKTES